MADLHVTDFTAMTGVEVAVGSDLIPIIDQSEAGAAKMKKITPTELFSTITAFQAADAALTALSGLAGTGFVQQTAPDTFSTVSSTGSGAVVLATGPTLVTPILGVATVTTINKVTVTQPATGATLTIQDGFTLTVSANANVSGTNTGDQTIILTGDVTGSGTGSFAATIAANAVTFAKFQQISTARILGRTTALTGNVEELTGTQVTAMLVNFVGDSGAGGTKGLVPAPGAGDAAALKFLKADGSWATTPSAPASANPALSNLSGVSINASLIPQATLDVGAQTTPWRDFYLYGSGTYGTHSFKLTGTPTGHRALTLPDGTVTLASLSNKLSDFAATSSAELLGVISDETGSGSLVFANTPTLVTPVLGVATATSINKVAITAPATGSTLTIQDGFTLTVTANATVSGTNTGDQTITLTGNVTGSGTGSFAATIANDAVTFAKMQNIAASKIIGRGSAGGTGDPEEITLDSGTLLMSGTTLSVIGGSSGANTALSNLASVSINLSLIPQTTLDLGAQTTPWRDFYLYGAGTYGTHSFKITGSPTAHRTITIPDLTGTVALVTGGTPDGTKFLRDDGVWTAVTGSGTPGGSDTQVQFNDGGSAFGGDSGLTFNKTTNVLTTTRDAIGATSSDGYTLINNTAAAVGAQQWSPRLRFTGQGWKTDATAASQIVDWVAENVPVQGTANPSTELRFSSQINGGGYSTWLTLTSSGQVKVNNNGGGYFWSDTGGGWNSGTLLRWTAGGGFDRFKLDSDGAGYGRVYISVAENDFTITAGANRSSGNGLLLTAGSGVTSVTILAGGATSRGLIVQGAASQSANLQEWQTSTPTVVAYVTPAGHVYSASLSPNTGYGSVGFGQGANLGAGANQDSVAIGSSSSANALRAIAIGSGFNYTTPTTADFDKSIAIGSGATTTAASQLVIGSSIAEITHGYIGNGITNTSPGAFTLHATGGSGANVAGANLILAAGKATGDAASGTVLIQTSIVGTSGSTLQTLETISTFSPTGLAMAAGKVLSFAGTTSGVVTIAPRAVAGTYTLTLPDTDGNANEVLKTDGSGNLSWTTAGGGLTGTDSITSASSPFSASTNNEILADATSGNITINLPAAASSANKQYLITKTDSSANTVTIDGNASETINGATTLVLSFQNSSVYIFCDGTKWNVF